jgi:hypothetical protein
MSCWRDDIKKTGRRWLVRGIVFGALFLALSMAPAASISACSTVSADEDKPAPDIIILDEDGKPVEPVDVCEAHPTIPWWGGEGGQRWVIDIANYFGPRFWMPSGGRGRPSKRTNAKLAS